MPTPQTPTLPDLLNRVRANKYEQLDWATGLQLPKHVPFPQTNAHKVKIARRSD